MFPPEIDNKIIQIRIFEAKRKVQGDLLAMTTFDEKKKSTETTIKKRTVTAAAAAEGKQKTPSESK